jgi:hypothetical protein
MGAFKAYNAFSDISMTLLVCDTRKYTSESYTGYMTSYMLHGVMVVAKLMRCKRCLIYDLTTG